MPGPLLVLSVQQQAALHAPILTTAGTIILSTLRVKPTKSNLILLVILLTLSTSFNAAFVICNILGKPNAASRTVLMNIDALYLTPQVVTSKPQFQNTFSAIATRFPICYLSLLKHLDMNAIVLGKQVRRTSFIKPKPSSLWVWTNVTNYDHYVIFILFSVNFLSSHTRLTRSYHVTSVYYFTVVYILHIRGFS